MKIPVSFTFYAKKNSCCVSEKAITFNPEVFMRQTSLAVFCSSRFSRRGIFWLLQSSGQPIIDDILKKLSGSLNKLRKTLGEIEEPAGGGPQKPKNPPEHGTRGW